MSSSTEMAQISFADLQTKKKLHAFQEFPREDNYCVRVPEVPAEFRVHEAWAEP